MGKKIIAVIIPLLLFAAASAVYFAKGVSKPIPQTKGVSISSPIAASSSVCHENHGLPDPNCTPGVAAVTDAGLICARGYTTKSVRPPVSYTEQLKKQQIIEYAYPDTNLADYEEDHLISLELGGSPTDPKNLWPEPRKQIANPGEASEDKDLVENKLHDEVCAGQISLSDAQKAIAGNWENYR